VEDPGKSGKYPPVTDDGVKKAVNLVAIGLTMVSVSAFFGAHALWEFHGFLGSVMGGIALVGGVFGSAAVIHLWRK
jgi:hypothetical protein